MTGLNNGQPAWLKGACGLTKQSHKKELHNGSLPMILNIAYNITQQYKSNHTILLNITCTSGHIQYSITQY